MDERRWERLGAVFGLLAVVLIVVAVFLTGTPPKPTSTDAQVKAFLVDKRGALLTQVVLLTIAMGLFLWFLATVRGALRAAEGGYTHLTDVFWGAAIVNAALVIIGTGAVIALVYKSLPGTDDGVARMMYDLGGVMIALAGIVSAVSALAFAVVVLTTRVLPRWAGWLAGLSAVAAIVGAFVVFSKTGAFSVEGAFGLVPFALAMLWTAGTAVALLQRR